MHSLFEKMVNELDNLSESVLSTISHDQTLYENNGIHNGIPFPLYTRYDLSYEASSIASTIRAGDWEDVRGFTNDIELYTLNIRKLRSNVVPGMNNAPPYNIYFLYIPTLRMIKTFIEDEFLLSSPNGSMREIIKEISSSRSRIRSLEKTLRNLEERSGPLENMIAKIEQAHDAADQLPTDLDSLREAKDDVKKYQDQARLSSNTADSHLISLRNTLNQIEEIHKKMNESEKIAKDILKNASKAYSAATSFGLSKAFSDRAKILTWTTAAWTAGLIISLGLGFYFGSDNIKNTLSLLQSSNSSDTSLVVNIILSFISVGGPIWFSWIATRQITQCFRLSEDYAFKAAVSRAYEGYRQETANLDALNPDEKLSTRLMGSALSRFDEQPLRLVNDGQHGSPFHELLNSDVIKKAISMFPDFGKQIIKLAEDAIANRKKGNASHDHTDARKEE